MWFSQAKSAECVGRANLAKYWGKYQNNLTFQDKKRKSVEYMKKIRNQK